MNTRTVSQLFDLKGKTALITGGSRGLGLQIAHALGEAGARVMLSARKAGELEQVPPREGQRYLGGVFGGAPIPGTGIFAALDMKTKRLVWQQRWKEPCYSGSVATAGGLVFVGRNDGRLTALNSATGKRLWEFQTGAGVNAPVSVFEYEAEQYIVAYSAGNLFAGSPRGDSIWLFSLKGTVEQATAP